MPSHRVLPKYRLHKGSGQAFVQHKEKRYYLGKYGTEASRQAYDRFIAALVAKQPKLKIAQSSRPGDAPVMIEILAAYLEFAEGYYHGGTRGNIRTMIAEVKRLYAYTPVDEFGPLALQALQTSLVASGCTRSHVNTTTKIVKRMFKWAVSQELVPVTIYTALTTVPCLRKGRTTAPELAPVLPVDDKVVDATIKHLSGVVADMVRFHRLVGARPTEVCTIRPGDIDRSGQVWLYRPQRHKTQHHGHDRVVMIGPKAQKILTPYLERPADAFCFSPREAMAERYWGDEKRAAKRPPKKRASRDRYCASTYGHAVAEATKKAGVPRWSPNQLRHSVATKIRQRFGIEAAQVVLGHSDLNTTEVYAEKSMKLAFEVAKTIG